MILEDYIMKTLVIVESPAKAKKIQNYLGDEYIVKSSFGHLTNLKSKNQGVLIDQDFKLVFEITKRKCYNELKETVKKCNKVIIASDEDREGESIGMHLINLLKLDSNENNRIVFNEITKSAILNAIKNPRKIDLNLVNAQKARQGLDYLVGFQVSPFLWRSIQSGLSAGRVQSVALKLITEKQKLINDFQTNKEFIVNGFFNKNINATLNKKFKEKEECIQFLNDCIHSIFAIDNITKKKITRNPPPPFITSTIQMEAGKRFGISAKTIMNTLQKLYEDGKITYHRTDSVVLSNDIKFKIKQYILDNYGEDYLKLRNYKNKSKNSQEAHEAIRPTNIQLKSLGNNTIDNKIYELIWKRTVASMMSPCILNTMLISIVIDRREEIFEAKTEKIIFDGYKKVYHELKKENNDDNLLSNLEENIEKGELLEYLKIEGKEKYKNPPTHYNDASLIKKMEGLEIGRPSTYASIIQTLLDRTYVEKKTFKGEKMDILKLELVKDKIKEKSEKQLVGASKNVLVPTTIGIMTCEYLQKHFETIMDYDFTKNIEQQLDEISNNNNNYLNVMTEFYKILKEDIDECSLFLKDVKNKSVQKKLLGKKGSKNLYIYQAKYGPCIQIGEDSDKDKCFVGVDNLDLTFEEALEKCLYPKNLGNYKGKDVFLKTGKYGFYLEYNKTNYKLKDDYDEHLTYENAIDCIENCNNKIIKKIGKYTIKNGTYGNYIQYGKTIKGIPSNLSIENIDLEKIEEIIKTKTKKFIPKKK